ncbi:hypothetical protein J6590_083619 [Homalodisca vitripennis]|nr:hypothetical protein J6590_083619 [Homalodisca vitripennis]
MDHFLSKDIKIAPRLLTRILLQSKPLPQTQPRVTHYDSTSVTRSLVRHATQIASRLLTRILLQRLLQSKPLPQTQPRVTHYGSTSVTCSLVRHATQIEIDCYQAISCTRVHNQHVSPLNF